MIQFIFLITRETLNTRITITVFTFKTLIQWYASKLSRHFECVQNMLTLNFESVFWEPRAERKPCLYLIWLVILRRFQWYQPIRLPWTIFSTKTSGSYGSHRNHFWLSGKERVNKSTAEILHVLKKELLWSRNYKYLLHLLFEDNFAFFVAVFLIELHLSIICCWLSNGY